MIYTQADYEALRRCQKTLILDIQTEQMPLATLVKLTKV
jgi:hypothetical protein